MSNQYHDKSESANSPISLYSWIGSFRDEEEMREIFLNMDKAMKYLHDRGYCVQTFDPRKIFILNNSINQIKFNYMKMPDDFAERRSIVKDDIYNSTFIQIGLYTKCLGYLSKEFLKTNFDDFTTFLPSGDAAYYRGVVERGAPIYFCEYAQEKANRDLAALENELGEESGKSLVKKDGKNTVSGLSVNEKINDNIYPQICGKKEAAFVNWLVAMTAILIGGVIFALVSFALSVI